MSLFDFLLLFLEVHNLALHLLGLALLKSLQVSVDNLADALEPTKGEPIASEDQADECMILLQQIHIYLFVLFRNIVIGYSKIAQLGQPIQAFHQMHEAFIRYLTPRKV